MAPEDVKNKKRKGAVDAVEPKKAKKSKKTDDAASAKSPAKPVDDAPVKVKSSKKRAAEVPLDTIALVEKEKKQKKQKKEKKAKVDVEVDAEVEAPKAKKSKKAAAPVVEDDTPAVTTKKSKSAKASKKQETKEELKPEIEVVDEEESEDENVEEDDQTAALLAGFDSDRDESDAEKEEGFDEDKFMDKVPKGLLKQTKKVQEKKEQPGVIFVGRIPHGFYEPQMKSYFSQFGKVTRVRVSRNKKTGASKHYAFVEFASAEVAEIVAKTMDKYLMFGHILQCRVIPSEQVHPDLFVGANQRFKRIPRSKMVGRDMTRGAERAVWDRRVSKEQKRRANKAKELKEKLGYEFTAPALKAVEDVPKKAISAHQAMVEAPAAEAAAPIEEAKSEEAPATEIVTVKKSKKVTKSKPSPDVEAAVVAVEEKTETVIETKPKKGKKAKVIEVVTEEKKVVEREAEPAAAVEEVTKPKKAKKAKKAKAVA